MLQAKGGLSREVRGAPRVERPMLLDKAIQTLPFDVLHYQEVGVAGLLGVESRDDVRMREPGSGHDLAVKALDSQRPAQQPGMNDLQGDEPIHDQVARLVDRAHAPFAEPFKQMIAGM